MQLVRKEAHDRAGNVTGTETNRISEQQILAARQEVLDVYMADTLETYLLQLIMATRQPQAYGDELVSWLQYGASPRGSIALDRCARAHAWLAGRDYVGPEDIQAIAYDVLRHRILLSYEAEAEGITPDHVIKELINRIAVP